MQGRTDQQAAMRTHGISNVPHDNRSLSVRPVVNDVTELAKIRQIRMENMLTNHT